MIDHYEFGSITIDGKRYGHDVIIFKGQVKDWWRQTSHNVSSEEAQELANVGAKTVIFGCGEAGVMKVSKEAEDLLVKKGIGVIKQKTGDATQTFNQMISDPEVLAALHLTC
jgi:hypothetical protein